MRATAISLLTLLPAAARSDDEPQPVPVTAEVRDKAIVAAMSYLDEEVWKLRAGGSPRREYTLAITGWAYLLAGDKPKAGRKLPQKKRLLDRIHKELARYVGRVAKLYERDDKKKKSRKKKKPPPDPRRAGFAGMRTAQYTWPLSVAALFFAESAARNKRKGECKKMLKAIAGILAASQQQNGGWGHDDAARPGMGLPPIRIPKPGGGQLTYPGTLLVTSQLALAALGAAQETLKTKRSATLERATRYFAAAQNGNGTFPYDPSQTHKLPDTTPMSGGISVARTPGAVYALLAAGTRPDAPITTKALAAIDKQPGMMSEGHGSAALALQFGALLADARGDRAWKTFRTIFLPRIVAKQQKSGAFLCIAQAKIPGVTVDTRELPGLSGRPGMQNWVNEGKTYVTAIHTLVLLLDRTQSRIAPDAPAPKGPVTPR